MANSITVTIKLAKLVIAITIKLCTEQKDAV